MNYKRLVISLIMPQLAGMIGSFFTFSAISVWYAGLLKPEFSPPNWIFGPVWTILYILMGVSIYLIWNKIDENKEAISAFWLFWVHLFFNALWSIIFFGMKNPGLAFAEIIVIWILIVVLMFKFYKIDRRATYLLIPYILWVSFASVLNYFIWYLN